MSIYSLSLVLGDLPPKTVRLAHLLCIYIYIYILARMPRDGGQATVQSWRELKQGRRRPEGRTPQRTPTQRGGPHRGPTTGGGGTPQGTHQEGRASQGTHHGREGPHRGPTQNTHRQFALHLYISIASLSGTFQEGSATVSSPLQPNTFRCSG